MKTFIVPNGAFFKVKKYLDMAVFWKRDGVNNIKVRPVARYARDILTKIGKEVVMRP